MLHTDSKTKAQIMLDEFTSVFTSEDTFSIPRVEGQSYPGIDQLQLNQEGVAKLLSLLDANKASGPDNSLGNSTFNYCHLPSVT